MWVGCQQGGEFFRSQGAAEVVTLSFDAGMGLQEGELLSRFNTLSHHPLFETLADRNNGGDDNGFLGSAADVVDERLVDLERIDRKTPQIAQTGIAGAKVIDGNLYSEVLERVQDRRRLIRVLHEPTFGQFKFEVARVQAGVAEDGTDPGDKILAVKLLGRDIDRNLTKVEASLQPGLGLATCFA